MKPSGQRGPAAQSERTVNRERLEGQDAGAGLGWDAGERRLEAHGELFRFVNNVPKNGSAELPLDGPSPFPRGAPG